jgi:hypothetical protein
MTKIPAILGILTTAVAVGGWMHSHAETTIEEADLEQRQLIDINKAEQKRLIDMNTAEFQLFKAELELERLMVKPDSERTKYDTYLLDQLIDDVDHWKNRVREIESA